MANTKQAKKMIRKTARKTAFNNWHKRKVKLAIKELESASAKKEPKNADLLKLSSLVQKEVDKSVKKGVIHKNKANRIKSKSSKLISTQLISQTKQTT